MILSLALVCFTFWMSFVAFRRKDQRLVRFATLASLSFSVTIFLAYAVLIVAFFQHDFSISYVYRYSERAMSAFYLFCAGWGGQDGSLLFWTMLMASLGALSIWHIHRRNPELFPAYLLVMTAIEVFFVIVTFFAADPFATLGFIPKDGKGLNPILQTPVMAIHPPNLYMGLIAFFVPFALGMAALMSAPRSNKWIRATRPWSLLAWTFLTLGNLLGAFWAYNELGWGGFWAWDPVENASFLPWLTATAFIHSAMIQERQGMLKVWNMSLLIVTFFLTIFGTFLTRSGLISSVHAFARSDIGEYFVVFLVIIVVFSVGMLLYRWKDLRSENSLMSPISREASFLLNNALFSIATFIIFLGTTYPLYREWVSGTKATVGPPFFNRALAPVALSFLMLLGVCSFLGWVRTESKRLMKLLIWPLVVGGIMGSIFYFIPVYAQYGNPDPLTRILSSGLFGLGVFVLVALVFEIKEGVEKRFAQGHSGWWSTTIMHLTKLRRRYGGYLVHVGVVFFFCGIAAYGFHLEKSTALAKGESIDIGRYLVVFQGMKAYKDKQKRMFEGHLTLHNQRRLRTVNLRENKALSLRARGLKVTLRRLSGRGKASSAAIWTVKWAGKTRNLTATQSFTLGTSGKSQLLRLKKVRWGADRKLQAELQWIAPGTLVAKMAPARHKYHKHMTPTTEVALKTRFLDDFYAVLATWETQKNGRTLAHFKFYLNPLMFWLWFGGFLMLLGVLVAGLPKHLWKPVSVFFTFAGVAVFYFEMLTWLTK
jgi:cytochrome c-type biogenesis protein CcmF